MADVLIPVGTEAATVSAKSPTVTTNSTISFPSPPAVIVKPRAPFVMSSPLVDMQSRHNPSVGAVPPAVWGQTLRNDMEFLVKPPSVSAYTNAGISVPGGTWVTLSLTSEEWDTDGFHSTSVTPERITIPQGLGGKYFVFFSVVWDATNTGNYKQAGLWSNGSLYADNIVAGNGQYTRQAGFWTLQCAEGQQFSLNVVSSPVAANLAPSIGSPAFSAKLQFLWVSL